MGVPIPVGYGTVDGPLVVPQDQPWVMEYRFWLGRGKGLPATVTAARAHLRKAGATTTALDMVVGGDLALDGQSVTQSTAEATLEALAPGTYQFELNVTLATGEERQVRASVNLISGLD